MEKSTVEQYLELFDSLSKASSQYERIEALGLGHIMPCGSIMLREDVQCIVEDVLSFIDGALSSNTHWMASKMLSDYCYNKYGYDNERSNTVYVIYEKDGNVPYVYIGSTSRPLRERWYEHPGRCPKLLWAFGQTDGGKGDWVCRPVLELPEDARSNDILLVIEAKIQKALSTVDTSHGLNCHYGNDIYECNDTDSSWRERYKEYVDYRSTRDKDPSQHSKDKQERTIGKWIVRQRHSKASMPTHRLRALDAVAGWTWSIHRSPTSATELIETLRSHPTVKSSGGMLMPPSGDKLAQQAYNLRKACNGSRHFILSEENLETIRQFLPGLFLNGHTAKFFLDATEFSKRYKGPRNLPSWHKDKKFASWLHHIQTEHTKIDKKRSKILEDLDLGWVENLINLDKVDV
jgi:hypothetical protein